MERKFQYFSEAIDQVVQGNRIRLRALAEMERDKNISLSLDTALRRNKVLIQAKQGELQRQANKDIAHAKVRAMSQLVEARKQQINRLFVAVAANLAHFTQDPGYADYLIQHIHKVSTVYDFAYIQLSPFDMRLENKIQAATNLIPEQGHSNFIGGFILISQNRNIRLDQTFKTRLDVARKDFAYDR